jgi:transposase-like protein
VAKTKLLELGKRWGEGCAIAVRSWEQKWDELATLFEYPAEIRRQISTTNSIEGYNRQLKVTKTKGAFPTEQVVRKLLFLVTRDITQKWLTPKGLDADLLNQMAIRFDNRFPPR